MVGPTVTVIFATTRLLTIVAVLSAFVYFQWPLFQVLEAINDAQVFENVIGNANIKSGVSLFGAAPSIDRGLSDNIFYNFLKDVQPDKNQVDFLTPLAAIKYYFIALLMTLGIALVAALLLSFVAYKTAVWIDDWDVRRGWWRRALSKFVNYLFDTLPYILWSIVVLWIAVTFYGSYIDYWFSYPTFLFLLYLGFGLFLLPFFVQENVRQFRTARHDGVFIGESMSGLSDKAIRSRLFKYRFWRKIPRQVLYGMIFMMLFDFSLFSVVNSSQPNQTPTVFVQANIHYDAYLNAKIFSDSSTYRDFLTAFAEQAPVEHQAQPLVKQLLAEPWRILAASNQNELQRLIKNDDHNFEIIIDKGIYQEIWVQERAVEEFDHKVQERTVEEFDPFQEQAIEEFDPSKPKQRFIEELHLPKHEQDVIFFKYIADYYIYMNVLVLFGLFMIFFLNFDMRKLFHNA
jgi:hypothetical protein